MIARSSLLLLLFAGFAGTPVVAQYGQSRVLWGFYVGSGLKQGFISSPRMPHRAWGEVNVGVSVGITGPNEHSVTAQLHVQHSRDDLGIKVGRGELYTIESLSLLINPEVAFPLMNRYRESKLDLLAGIGADFLIDHWVSMRNVTGYYAGSALTPLEDSVYGMRRKMIPYATVGLAFKFHRRASLVLRLRQDARNLFDKDSQITLLTSRDERTVNLSSQATRFLVGFQIRLGKMTEDY